MHNDWNESEEGTKTFNVNIAIRNTIFMLSITNIKRDAKEYYSK